MGELLAVGAPFAHSDNLPPGDSWGFYWSAGEGLRMLGVARHLTTPELQGWNSGPVQVAVGICRGKFPAVAIACQVQGWGWCDGVIANVPNQQDTPAAMAEAALSWADPGDGRTHGTMTAVLVERTAQVAASSPAVGWVRLDQSQPGGGDIIAGLRFFTLSPAMTSWLGRWLSAVYLGPVMSPADYEMQVEAHQAEHPDIARWARKVALHRCKAGD